MALEVTLRVVLEPSEALLRLLAPLIVPAPRAARGGPQSAAETPQAAPPGTPAAILDVSSRSTAEGPSCAAVALSTPAAQVAAGAFPLPDWLTPDRLTELRRLAATGARYLRPSLARLPGPELPPVNKIMLAGRALGLDLGAPDWLTDARRQALQALYPTAETFQLVWDGVRDASPDVPMPRERNVLRNQALAMKLKRPDSAVRPAMRKALEARHMKSEARAAAPAAASEGPPPETVEAAAADAEGTRKDSLQVGRATIGDAVRAAGAEDRLVAMLARPKQAIPAAPVSTPIGAPKVATRNQIIAECTQRGWYEFTASVRDSNLDAINARCHKLGHPGFALREPERRSA